MIAVIDYDTGNLRSVENALRRLGGEYVVTDRADLIRRADHVLLPGVGEASSAMAKLRERGLDEVICSLTQPVLGICIGMQLMCRHSEEGDARCLAIFDADVRKLPSDMGLKVPHMGWDTVLWGPEAVTEPNVPQADKPQQVCAALQKVSPLLKDLPVVCYVYYVHSFAPTLCESTVAVTDYGVPFSAALQRNNFFGTQFHPEKSGATGERILQNFLRL